MQQQSWKPATEFAPELEGLIRRGAEDPSRISAYAVREVVRLLDVGLIRVAEPQPDGTWIINDWVKMAVLQFFNPSVSPMYVGRWGIRSVFSAILDKIIGQKLDVTQLPLGHPALAFDYEWHDKVPLKTGLAKQGVRVVPPGTVRYGAHLERGCVVMPGYVNIGAWVGEGSMVDTWATVGSCAQIGRRVHISGGVGIGGVLEPANEKPVTVGDGAFLGSRAIVVEGFAVGLDAVVGANTVLTKSMQIVDVSGSETHRYKGKLPPRSVVIPSFREKKFNGETFNVPCALVVGKRKESTDKKTSLNDALREFEVAA